jgi:hypothetical protein
MQVAVKVLFQHSNMANRSFFNDNDIRPSLSINNPVPRILTGTIRYEPWPNLSVIRAGQHVFDAGIDYVHNYIVRILKNPDARFTSIQITTVEKCVDRARNRAHLDFATPAVSKFADFHAGAVAMLRRMAVQTGSAQLVRRMDIIRRTMEIGVHDHFVRLLHMVLQQGMTETEAQRALQAAHDLVDGSLTIGKMRFVM